MKKISKRILSMMLITMILLANITTAMAAERRVEPRAVVCGNCTGGVLFETRRRTERGTCKEVKCSHGGILATDHEHNWIVVVTIECNKCGSRTWYDTTEFELKCTRFQLGGLCPY